MAVHFEDVDATVATVTLRRRGEWIGETQVKEFALAISGDSVVAVYGSELDLLKFSERVLAAVAEAVAAG